MNSIFSTGVNYLELIATESTMILDENESNTLETNIEDEFCLSRLFSENVYREADVCLGGAPAAESIDLLAVNAIERRCSLPTYFEGWGAIRVLLSDEKNHLLPEITIQRGIFTHDSLEPIKGYWGFTREIIHKTGRVISESMMSIDDVLVRLLTNETDPKLFLDNLKGCLKEKYPDEFQCVQFSIKKMPWCTSLYHLYFKSEPHSFSLNRVPLILEESFKTGFVENCEINYFGRND